MKNISQLDKAFSDYVTRLKAKLEEAQLHATEYMLEEAKERMERTGDTYVEDAGRG